MCSHTSKKRSKPLTKTFGTKPFHKSSYTILEGPLEKRHGEQVKTKINASQFKITLVSGWKSSTKGKKSTSTSGWRR
jgi:hypothetical protein